MKINGQLLEMENNTLNANIVKTLVLDKLLMDKVITDEQYLEYEAEHNIIIIKHGWFKSWMKRFSKDKPETYAYSYVKF